MEQTSKGQNYVCRHKGPDLIHLEINKRKIKYCTAASQGEGPGGTRASPLLVKKMIIVVKSGKVLSLDKWSATQWWTFVNKLIPFLRHLENFSTGSQPLSYLKNRNFQPRIAPRALRLL